MRYDNAIIIRMFFFYLDTWQYNQQLFLFYCHMTVNGNWAMEMKVYCILAEREPDFGV